MASREVRERLAQDVGLWLADGLVSKETHDLLRERYGAREFGFANAIRTLGVAGGLVAFFGLLGMVAAISQSQLFAAFLLLAAGVSLTVAGIRLAVSKLGRYAISSKAILMLGVVTATLGVGVALNGMGVRNRDILLLTGAVVLLPIGILAYRYKNTFLLIMGLLAFFHWVGSWTQMWGRSTYELSIQDPRLMSAAALVAVLVGIYHEQQWRNETGRFYQAYETVGLIYLNLSLLILTIDWRPRLGDAALWIGVWAVAAIAQIVAGAALHNSLLTGFGVTAFAINVYTRYYENFWNRMHAGLFFLAGGLSLFLAGLLCELALRRWQQRVT